MTLQCVLLQCLKAAYFQHQVDIQALHSDALFNNDVLCLVPFFLKMNFIEAEGLVISDRIEYSF
jgi:hypothetical protein